MRFKEFLNEAGPVWSEKVFDEMHVDLHPQSGDSVTLQLVVTYRNNKEHTISIRAKVDGQRTPNDRLRAFYNEPETDWPLNFTIEKDDVSGMLPKLADELIHTGYPDLQGTFDVEATDMLRKFVNRGQIADMYDGDKETRKKLLQRIKGKK